MGSASSYGVTPADAGKQLRLVVSYTDGEGFSETVTAAAGAVPIPPPSIPPGITVSPTSGLVTTEAGGTATFTVMLNSQPTSDVIIGLSSTDTTEGSLSISSLTFNAANWNIAQSVTVTGVDDPIVDGNITYSIHTAPAISTDANYNGINASDISLTNNDNERLTRPRPPRPPWEDLPLAPRTLPEDPKNPILNRPTTSGPALNSVQPSLGPFDALSNTSLFL